MKKATSIVLVAALCTFMLSGVLARDVSEALRKIEEDLHALAEQLGGSQAALSVENNSPPRCFHERHFSSYEDQGDSPKYRNYYAEVCVFNRALSVLGNVVGARDCDLGRFRILFDADRQVYLRENLELRRAMGVSQTYYGGTYIFPNEGKVTQVSMSGGYASVCESTECRSFPEYLEKLSFGRKCTINGRIGSDLCITGVAAGNSVNPRRATLYYKNDDAGRMVPDLGSFNTRDVRDHSFQYTVFDTDLSEQELAGRAQRFRFVREADGFEDNNRVRTASHQRPCLELGKKVLEAY